MKTALVILIGIAGVVLSALASLSLEQFFIMGAVWFGFVAIPFAVGMYALEQNMREHRE